MEYAQKLFSTRGGTMVLAGVAALIAGIAVFVYVTNYRDSVREGGQAAHVVVPNRLIPEGTPGEAVLRDHSFQLQDVRESQLLEGALTDPAALRGRTAVQDVFPNQQITEADFVPTGTALATSLAPRQRAITLSFDSTHGIVNALRGGDRVDVYAIFNVVPVDSAGRATSGSGQSRPLLRLIMQDVHVVEVLKSSDTGSAQLTFRVKPSEAAKLAFARDNGNLWLTLRPPSGAKASPPSAVTVETLMLGVRPVIVLRELGARK
jgi:Flp pilus assembly protein CpaB